ncbi:hypothetical protein Q5P01_019656 [Channa striata]|uniref:Uncharacterized protein n=1 Tax=Channa striata TaxID=64152 RepID=A0AA88M1X2_CHASR|nr:hypothetical protein Q5P01_019656 [Channa striata]
MERGEVQDTSNGLSYLALLLTLHPVYLLKRLKGALCALMCETCLPSSGSLFQCGCCCQLLKLENKCQNSQTRNSALILNAAKWDFYCY